MSISYTAGEEQILRFDSEILGQRQPWTVSHRGLEYPGEVVVAETVNAEWGQPLAGDICFRIVLYTVPRRIPAGQIRDPRIAMVVPRRPADPTRESLSREIQAIHEAKERYITETDPKIFQPMNANFGLLNPPEKKLSKAERKTWYAERALKKAAKYAEQV